MEDFKRKPYDLLDYSKNTFDRDFLEFNVNVAELETALQGFINASFENITRSKFSKVSDTVCDVVILAAD